MIEVKGKSFTTVGFYLRSLRVIFNLGIESNVVNKDLYPFGVKRYEIPSSSNTKKAFDSSQLGILFHSEAQTSEQEKARDFWFFSFACNGMNMKDILQLLVQETMVVFCIISKIIKHKLVMNWF